MSERADIRLTLSAALTERGLPAHGFIGSASLRAYIRRLDATTREAWGLEAMRGAVVAALPYDPRPLPPSRGDFLPEIRLGTIAAFASAHRYATLSRILKGVAAAIGREAAYARADFRIAVNSPLPEKALAVLAGIAFIGRSSLAIHAVYGPSCVLGALFLPFDPFDAEFGRAATAASAEAASAEAASAEAASAEAASAEADSRGDGVAFIPGGLCGTCRACVAACPAGAIAEPGTREPGISRRLCVQHWAADGAGWSRLDEAPPDVASAWGARLYGCDECVRACPYAKGSYEPGPEGLSPASAAASLALAKEERPGPYVDLDYLAKADSAAVQAWSAGSALGFSWLGGKAIQRNARMALLSYLEPFGI